MPETSVPESEHETDFIRMTEQPLQVPYLTEQTLKLTTQIELQCHNLIKQTKCFRQP